MTVTGPQVGIAERKLLHVCCFPIIGKLGSYVVETISGVVITKSCLYVARGAGGDLVKSGQF